LQTGLSAHGPGSAVRGEPNEWQVSGGDGSTPNGGNGVASGYEESSSRMSGLGSELLCGGAAGQPYPIDFAGVVSGPKLPFLMR